MSYKSQITCYCFRLAVFMFTMLTLSGCVDLSGASRAFETKAVAEKTSKTDHKDVAEIHTMLGGLGLFSRGMLQLRDSSAQRFDVSSSSSIWYNAGHVTASIKKNYYAHNPHRPIILMGHSLGANEQIKVARNLNKEGIPVDLLVTIDAVSQTIVPPNVKEALNMYKSGYVPMFSGLKLRAVNPNVTHIENVDVTQLKGVHVNHFTIDKDEVVQAMILDKVDKVLRNAKRVHK
ncbi:MAG: hypothetical protein ACHP6H_03675 [Legionellales bacterium]